MSLEPVGKLVAAHSSSLETEEMKVRQADVERAMIQRMTRWITWGMLILGIGVLMLVLNKSFVPGKELHLVASLLLLTGVGMALYGVLTHLRDGATLTSKTNLKSIPLGEPTKSLPTRGTPVSLPSVTERTTQLIAPPNSSEAHGQDLGAENPRKVQE